MRNVSKMMTAEDVERLQLQKLAEREGRIDWERVSVEPNDGWVLLSEELPDEMQGGLVVPQEYLTPQHQTVVAVSQGEEWLKPGDKVRLKQQQHLNTEVVILRNTPGKAALMLVPVDAVVCRLFLSDGPALVS